MSDLHGHGQIAAREIPGLQWDFRLGGKPRLIIATNSELMQIPPEIRKCVGFLGCNTATGLHIGGTAFFVRYEVPELVGIQGAAFYIVTARHVMDDQKGIGRYSVDGSSILRVNHRQHGIQDVKINLADWVLNDDPRIDVAIAPCPIELFTQCDHLPISSDLFVRSEVIQKEQIGTGDEIFFPGLFTGHPGEGTNAPIIRIGNISAMPNEPLKTKESGFLRPVYLAEARSIGGLSGSPVFVQTGGNRTIGNTISLRPPKFYFLGLVHGHFERETDFVNMGIGVVVPADDIQATFDHPRLKGQRDVWAQTVLAEQKDVVAVPDSRTIDVNPGS